MRAEESDWEPEQEKLVISFAKEGDLSVVWPEQPDLPGARIAEDFAGQRREAERVVVDLRLRDCAAS